MSSDEDAIRRVVEAFEASDWAEIDVKFGNIRIHLSSTVGGAAPTTPLESWHPETLVATDAEIRSVEGATSSARTTAVWATDDDLPPGAHLVLSPSPGIFWVAAEPGAPPFVDVGRRVEESSTIGIVEVMKLMNHVKAGVAGQVVAVLVGNGAAVKKDEALVAVIADASEIGT